MKRRIQGACAWLLAGGFLLTGAAPAGEPAAASLVGTRVGISEPELRKRVALPAGLELLSAVHHASGARLVIARRGDDLLLLLTDDAGTVLDQVDLPGAADARRPSPACTLGAEDVLIGLIPADAGPGTVPADRAWNARDGKLVPVAGAVECLGADPAGDAAPPAPGRGPLLTLVGPATPALVGEPFAVELRLEGVPVLDAIAATPGLVRAAPDGQPLPGMTPDAFAFRFQVRPTAPGSLTLGPYTLPLLGQDLRSNPLTVEVVAPGPEEMRISLEARPAAVRLGQTLELTAFSRSPAVARLALVEDRRFEVVSRRTAIELTTSGGVQTSRHTATFTLKPTRRGKLRFDRKSFGGLETRSEVRPVTVVVR